ncbi:uncharacterized protein B0H18DRAFT_891048, partial [Fomitopsis serialis]|uniref:uncharacterized protein n=1 Tax=Fomitopsis serialis TaxID=139415 RepID=UPI0020073533
APAALQPRCPANAATIRPEPPPAGYCSSPTLRPEPPPAGHCLSPTLRPLSSPGRPEGLPTLAIPHGQAPLVRVCNGN